MLLSALTDPVSAGTTVSGRVTDLAGAPLGDGVEVRIGFRVSSSFASAYFSEIARAAVNPDGTYELANIPAGSYALLASAPDRVPTFHPSRHCADSDVSRCVRSSFQDVVIAAWASRVDGLDFTLPRYAGLSGRVLDGVTLQPIADAGVALNVVGIHGSAGRFVRTDAQGRFAFEQLGGGDFTLSASYSSDSMYLVSHYRGVSCTGSSVDSCSPPLSQTTFTLAQEEVRSGADMLALKGAKVRVFARDAQTGRAVSRRIAVYDAESHALLDQGAAWGESGFTSRVIDATEVKVEVARDRSREPSDQTIRYPDMLFPDTVCGFEPCQLDQGGRVDLLPDSTAEINFDLPPRFLVTGQALDSAGSPLAGIPVVSGIAFPDRAFGRWSYAPLFSETDRTTTDLEGRFVLAGLAGLSLVMTRTEGTFVDTAFPSTPCVAENLFCHSEALLVDLLGEEGRMVDLGSATLAPGGAIDGTVRGSIGESVHYAQVFVLHPETWQKAKVVYADAEGRYTLSGLVAGDHVLAAHPSGSGKTEIYKGNSCARTYSEFAGEGCPHRTHTPVSLQPGQVLTGIDFEGPHRLFLSGFETLP